MAVSQVLIVDETSNLSFGNARPFPVTNVVTTATLVNGNPDITVTGTAAQVLGANTSRKFAVVQNTGAANVRVGVSGVTANTGIQLTPGNMLVFEAPWVHQGAIWAVREGATSSTVFATEAT